MAHVNLAMSISHLRAPFTATAVRKGGAPVSTAGSTSPSTTPSTTPTTPTTTPSDAAADFRALFTSHSNPPAAAPQPPVSTAAPTAQSLFGPNPWMSNPGGTAPNGVTYGYNPYYFATADTAAKVAQMVGGTVVQANAITPYGPFQQNAPNYMVQLPNGRQIYAGIFASFYDHGYTQEFVNRLVASEINGTGTEMQP